MSAEKERWQDLAVFGGTPAFAAPLHVGTPNIGSRDLFHHYLDRALDRRWLTNGGPCVTQFEREISAHTGGTHTVATCNATIALEIAIRAAGLTGEVIIPAFTFIATAHALEWLGITPVFCDIDPLTHNIDIAAVERSITPRTTGIIGVHLWGRPCAIDALTQLAAKHGLVLLFDAAHAFGVRYQGRPLGDFGDASIFSFHATKVLNTFEGGALVTAVASLAERAATMRAFGFVDYDEVVSVGTNGKMSEAAAAMGLSSLASYEYFVTRNAENYQEYRDRLANLHGLRLLPYDEPAQRPNFHYVVIEVDATETGLSRDELQKILWAENILARRYFFPGCHRMEPYRSRKSAPLPYTETVASRVLCLPTGAAVSTDEISRVAEVVRLALNHSGEIAQRLPPLSR